MQQRRLPRFQGGLDGGRQRAAMLLGIAQLAARIRILIAAAAHQELGRDARMVLLEILLGIAGVVSEPLAKAHRRIVAGIAEHHGAQLSTRVEHAEHGTL